MSVLLVACTCKVIIQLQEQQASEKTCCVCIGNVRSVASLIYSKNALSSSRSLKYLCWEQERGCRWSKFHHLQKEHFAKSLWISGYLFKSWLYVPRRNHFWQWLLCLSVESVIKLVSWILLLTYFNGPHLYQWRQQFLQCFLVVKDLDFSLALMNYKLDLLVALLVSICQNLTLKHEGHMYLESHDSLILPKILLAALSYCILILWMYTYFYY